MSDQPDDNERSEPSEEEFLRKLFGDAFGDTSDDDGQDAPEDSGPSIGFTGSPGGKGQGAGQDSANPGGGFPGFPPGFDPSQLPPGFGDPQMMQQIMGQVQAMFSAMQTQGDETVNWEMSKNAAVSALGNDDAAVTPVEAKQIDDALRLAEMWLNEATSFEALGTIGQGLSRKQWIEQTFDSWQRLTGPVAESVGRAMAQVVRQQLEEGGGAHLPEELKGMLPPDAAGQMASMMERMGSVAFGVQIGQAIGELAAEVHSGSDIGLPLAGSDMTLVPANVRAFGKGLQVEDDEILLYLALREAARMRLFVRAPWLEDDLFNAVAQYAAGIHINMERVEEAASQIDPSNPQEMEDLFGEGLFQSDRTPMQEAALRRIETTLALVEGWVDDVVAQAGAHLPSLGRLRETMNRRRATGGPAEAAFAALAGLELRPRRLRDAAALWAQLRESHGVAGRDEVWSHPDVQPDEADLDDPAGFASRRAEREAESAKIDDELKKLLEGGYDGPGGDSSAPDAGSGPDPGDKA